MNIKLYTEKQVKEMLSTQRTLCAMKASVIGEPLTVEQIKKIISSDETPFPDTHHSLPTDEDIDKYIRNGYNFGNYESLKVADYMKWVRDFVLAVSSK